MTFWTLFRSGSWARKPSLTWPFLILWTSHWSIQKNPIKCTYSENRDCSAWIHLQVRRTSGCSRRAKGGPSEWPILPGEPQKSYQPFCGKFATVNELFVNHTHIYVCDHRANNLCMYLGIFFFSNFSNKFIIIF